MGMAAEDEANFVFTEFADKPGAFLFDGAIDGPIEGEIDAIVFGATGVEDAFTGMGGPEGAVADSYPMGLETTAISVVFYSGTFAIGAGVLGVVHEAGFHIWVGSDNGGMEGGDFGGAVVKGEEIFSQSYLGAGEGVFGDRQADEAAAGKIDDFFVFGPVIAHQGKTAGIQSNKIQEGIDQKQIPFYGVNIGGEDG